MSAWDSGTKRINGKIYKYLGVAKSRAAGNKLKKQFEPKYKYIRILPAEWPDGTKHKTDVFIWGRK